MDTNTAQRALENSQQFVEINNTLSPTRKKLNHILRKKSESLKEPKQVENLLQQQPSTAFQLEVIKDDESEQKKPSKRNSSVSNHRKSLSAASHQQKIQIIDPHQRGQSKSTAADTQKQKDSVQSKGEENEQKRLVGTPYIEKRPLEIHYIQPVQSNISYTMIFQSPLEQNYQDLNIHELVPSKNFFTSIKSPSLKPREIYNKIINDKLLQKKNERQENQKQKFKPPLPLKRQQPQNNALANLKKNLENNSIDLSINDSRDKTIIGINNNKVQKNKTSKLFDTSDQQQHLRILDDIKQELKKVLKDNLKQIEQMNEDTKFYQECRDLINEVFDKDPTHHENQLLESFQQKEQHILLQRKPGVSPIINQIQQESCQTNKSQSPNNKSPIRNSLSKNEQRTRNKSNNLHSFESTKQTMKTSKSSSKKVSFFKNFSTASEDNLKKLKEKKEELIPLIYFDKESQKTIVKFQASMKDKKKVHLIKQLGEIRQQRNKVAKVLEKVIKMYDILTKERFEKAKICTPRTLQRVDQKISHLQQLVNLIISRFNVVIKQKTKILDDIFQMALPKQKNPLAKISDLAGINNQFLDQISEDVNAYKTSINTVGLSGNLSQRLTYLNLMHKSLSIFQNILLRKVQEVQIQNKEKIKKNFSPRKCVLPTGLETSVIFENFELDKNYFSKEHKAQKLRAHDHKKHFSSSFTFHKHSLQKYGTFIAAAKD